MAWEPLHATGMAKKNLIFSKGYQRALVWRINSAAFQVFPVSSLETLSDCGNDILLVWIKILPDCGESGVGGLLKLLYSTCLISKLQRNYFIVVRTAFSWPYYLYLTFMSQVQFLIVPFCYIAIIVPFCYIAN